MKKKLLIAIPIVVLVLVATVVSFKFGDLMNIRSKPVAKSFTNAIMTGQNHIAYSLLSPSFQQNITESAFDNSLQKEFPNYRKSVVTTDSVIGTDGRLAYVSNFLVTDGKTPSKKVIMKMVEVDRKWYVGAIKVST